MFDHLVKVNGLEEVMVRHGLTLPDDLIFIKEQIAGPLDNCVLDRVCVTVISCFLVDMLRQHRLTSTALSVLQSSNVVKVKIMWLKL